MNKSIEEIERMHRLLGEAIDEALEAKANLEETINKLPYSWLRRLCFWWYSGHLKRLDKEIDFSMHELQEGKKLLEKQRELMNLMNKVYDNISLRI